MSDDTEPKNSFDESLYDIVEATSTKGNPYKIAYPKNSQQNRTAEEEAALKSELEKKATSASDDVEAKVMVWWEPGGGWHEAEKAVKDLGISRYSIVPDGTIPNTYTLNVTNTKGWFFRFTDLTGDTYPLTTVRNGDHWLVYMSMGPTIIRVE